MPEQNLLRKTYRFQLRPTRRQVRLLESALAVCCEIYNAALQERIGAWKCQRKTVSYYDQTLELTEVRTLRPDIASLPVDLAREPLRRVDRAYQAFFRRLKAGDRPGFPRFRSQDRYNSLALSRFRIEGSTLVISKLGGFKMRLHREIRGLPKHATLCREGKRWRVSVVCAMGEAPEKRSVASAIGIDLGVKTFAVLSDGNAIAQPDWAGEQERRIAEKARALARAKRGSCNRRKAREQVRRAHQRVANLRNNFCHHFSRWLVSTFDLIAFEKLRIRAMTRGHMAKAIMAAAWGILLNQIRYKAAEAGAWAVGVDPRGSARAADRR